jgi:hypothetical protein
MDTNLADRRHGANRLALLADVEQALPPVLCDARHNSMTGSAFFAPAAGLRRTRPRIIKSRSYRRPITCRPLGNVRVRPCIAINAWQASSAALGGMSNLSALQRRWMSRYAQIRARVDNVGGQAVAARAISGALRIGRGSADRGLPLRASANLDLLAERGDLTVDL